MSAAMAHSFLVYLLCETAILILAAEDTCRSFDERGICQQPGTLPEKPDTLPEVPRQMWDVSDKAAIDSLVQKQVPLVLTGLGAAHLPALKNWRWGSDKFLSKLPSEIPQAKVNRYSNTFIYWNSMMNPKAIMSKKLEKPLFAKWSEQVVRKVDLFTDRQDKHAGNESYMYYSGPVSLFPKLEADVKKSVSILCDRSCQNRNAHVWLSTHGVVTQAHLDPSHNLFVQMDGYKRFILFPPGNVTGLHLYPPSHPSSRQSQVDTFDKIFKFSGLEPPHVNDTALHEAAGRFPSLPAAVASASSTLLSPGDVLFLPAGWGHLVFAFGSKVAASTTTTTTPSSWFSWFDSTSEGSGSGCISYSVWFASQLSLLRSHQLEPAIGQAFNHILDPSWSKKDMISAARALLKHVALAAGHPNYARNVFNEQYKPMVHKASQQGPLDEATFCAPYRGDKRNVKKAGGIVAHVIKQLSADVAQNELAVLHGEIANWLLQSDFMDQDAKVRPTTHAIQFMRSFFECPKTAKKSRGKAKLE